MARVSAASCFHGRIRPLAAAAARQLGKPVKLVVSRKMMFQTVGHRPRTQQRVRLGATPDGKLVSLQHDYVYDRSMLDDHHEDCGEATPFQYSVPNLRVTFGRAKRNIGAASDMRGPGAVPGLYATESAMNELADLLKIDPVRLRILNEPKIDEGLGLPFSSRHLLECFELGAEKFGWSKRTPEVGSMKRDGLTLGWGMAGCSWIAARFAAEASVQLRDDGTARVACATQDIGTGTYTILAQLASAEDRRAARQNRSGAWRYFASGRPDLGRFHGDRIGGPGGLCSGRQRDRLVADHRDDDAGIAV